MMITQDKINELRKCLELDGFTKNGDGSFRGNCPWRAGSDSKGFVVNLGGAGKIGWCDHAKNETGKLSDLAAHYGIASFEANGVFGQNSNNEYIYTDEAGKPVYKVIRLPDKEFPQKHFCAETNDWQWGLGGKRKYCNCPKIEPLPYHLPALAKATSGSIVIICEGEKDVLTAEKMGFIATCNSGGAGKWGKMCRPAYTYFKGQKVVVIADNDDAGIKHAEDVANRLHPYALTVQIIRFDGGKGYDLTDWANDGNDAQSLLDAISNAPLYEPQEVAADAGRRAAATAERNAAQRAPAAPPQDAPDLLPYSAADEGNAKAFMIMNPGRYLFTNEVGWLFYNGKCWDRGGAEETLGTAIIDTLIERRSQAVVADLEPIVKATRPSANNVRNCKYMLKHYLWADLADFDNDPDLLNCANGVVNLRTGEITPHSNEQRFTYCIDTPYDPAADDSIWAEWVYETITPAGSDDDGQYADLATWLQMAVGYSLTGHTHEQCLFFLQGPPRGGKGLFLQILNKLLGRPLSSGTDFDTFTANRGGDNQNFDLAPLKSCRLITASESNRTTILNAKRVKAITGNDPVYCAHKRKDFFSYTPQYKIWLSSNFKVKAAADDDGLWSRLRIIRFPNSHLGKEDYGLEARLWAHRTGILKWAIEGAITWYRRKEQNAGLGHPAIITAAVRAHREENDTVGQFIEDCCVTGPDHYAVATLLNTEYKNWCNENSLPQLGGRRFSEALRQRGYEYKLKRLSGAGTPKRCWFGIGLSV